MASEKEHFDAAVKYQEYYNDSLRDEGVEFEAPVYGQLQNQYRRKQLNRMTQGLSWKNQYRHVPVDELDATALGVLEPQIIREFKAERQNPSDLEDGELRKVEIKDKLTNRISNIIWKGKESFVKFMGTPGRRGRINPNPPLNEAARRWYSRLEIDHK
jgi:hypothetical protein